MTELQTTLNDVDLRFYFILKDGIDDIENVSNDMNIAYTNIQEYFNTEGTINWLKESECLNLTNLTKKDIFVLQEFSGRGFEYLKSTKCLIIGPRCVISCLLESLPVPLGNSPIFTVAMRDLYISVSGLSPEEKQKIKDYVSWMGGYYFDVLTTTCQYLVSNTVISKKYEQAALSNIKIMHPNWVYDVWERSQNENILATSKEFDKHKLKIFYNLNITSTGLKIDKRDEIKKLIIDNGGNYLGGFKSSITDILILEKSGTDSQKFKAAINYKKECLTPDWIFDSVEKGYAIPFKDYQVRSIKVSTPTKDNKAVSAVDFNPDSTEISEISQFLDGGKSYSTINETCSSTVSSLGKKTNPSSQKKTYQDEMDQLNAYSKRDIKKAGSFLDGCRIYLTGFTLDEKEKLNVILNSGGAIRYEEVNENITHIIVGESSNHLNELQSMQNQTQLMGIVTLKWLLESFKLRQPAEENNFLFRVKLSVRKEPEAPSPSSRKTIQSMNYSFKKPTVSRKLNLDSDEKQPTHEQINKENLNVDDDNLLQQYKSHNFSNLPLPKPQQEINIEPGPSSGPTTLTSAYQTYTDGTTTYTEDIDQCDFFEGLAIYVDETEDEEYCEKLIIVCENAGGKVVSNIYKQIVDYIIVSSERTSDISKIPVKGRNIVNTLWLEDALDNKGLVERKYFHEPIPSTADKKPLMGINIVTSIYTGNERIFLQTLITILGAKANDAYVKHDRPLLLCPSPKGAKYQAALQWANPVVTAEWLIECAKCGEKIDLHPYLVGEATVSERWERYVNNESTLNSSDINLEKSSFKQPPPKELNMNEQPAQPEFVNKQGQMSVEKNFDNIPATDNITLRHRRVSELTTAKQPNTESATSPLTDFVKRFPTPVRSCIYEVCKESENQETPPSQKLRKLVATPGKTTTPKMPESCTTPEIEKRKLEICNRYYIPKGPRPKSTPLSEIKRLFWKKALGQHYWEPEDGSQKTGFDEDIFGTSENQQQDTQNFATNTNMAACTSSSTFSKIENFKRLNDFIKNCNLSDTVNDEKQEQFIHNTEDDNAARNALHKLDSEMVETGNLVGWNDLNELLPDRRNKNQMRYKGMPKFSISCSNEQLKQEIINKIKSLNGDVCKNLVNYDDTCTHIVCEKPNRGEKILSCIAAGKWILSLKYIEDSYKQGHFLNEESYEWGNPETLNSTLIKMEKTIASAAFRWRTKLENEKQKGVFYGFRCILHVTKKEQFERLITAGNGVVLNVKPPYNKNKTALTATHCFVETKTSKLTGTDHLALKKAGINVLSIMYLNVYLTSDHHPDMSKYLLSI